MREVVPLIIFRFIAVFSVVAIVLNGKCANELDAASMQTKEASYRYGRLGDALSAAFIGFFALLFHERVLIAVITSAVIIINTR